MEKVFNRAEELAGTIREYIDARISGIKLQAAEKASMVVSNMLAFIVVALVIFLSFAMGSVGIALLIGTWVGKTWAGFLILSLFYVILSYIVWAGRIQWIRIPMMNAILEQLFEKEEDHEKD